MVLRVRTPTATLDRLPSPILYSNRLLHTSAVSSEIKAVAARLHRVDSRMNKRENHIFLMRLLATCTLPITLDASWSIRSSISLCASTSSWIRSPISFCRRMIAAS